MPYAVRERFGDSPTTAQTCASTRSRRISASSFSHTWPTLARWWMVGLVERLALVWGNCQAEALRRLLAPLGGDLTFRELPPVHEITAAQRDEVLALMPRVELLVAQPISDEYRVTGLGTQRLASLLPPTGMLVTFPVVFLESWFPWQVYARDGRDEVVEAPLTDYHDLRVITAAARGWGVAEALAGWETFVPPAEGVQEVDRRSRAELGRRQAGLDVQADLTGPHAMVSINHPTEPVMAQLATDVAARAGLVGTVERRPGTAVGGLRSPLERPVLDALGFADERATGWQVGGRAVGLPELLAAQLAFYQATPAVVGYALDRYADRLELLGLSC